MNVFCTSGPVWGNVWAIIGIGSLLLMFGVGFDQLTSYLSRIGWTNGRSSILVVVGTVITLGASGLVLGWGALWILIAFFTCSGTPMLLGQLVRNWRNEKDFQARLLRGDFDNSNEDLA